MAVVVIIVVVVVVVAMTCGNLLCLLTKFDGKIIQIKQNKEMRGQVIDDN